MPAFTLRVHLIRSDPILTFGPPLALSAPPLFFARSGSKVSVGGTVGTGYDNTGAAWQQQRQSAAPWVSPRCFAPAWQGGRADCSCPLCFP